MRNTERLCKLEPKATKQMATGSYLSIITLNINGLNAPTKRQRLAEWIKNKTPIYVVYKRTTSKQGTHRLKLKGWKNIFYANGDQNKAGVAILILGKIDFEIKGREKRQRRTLHSINPRRRYNNCKYICTQHRSTAICKTNANKDERGN